MDSIIGIDVGGTFIKWGRADSSGTMQDFGKVPTVGVNPDGVPTKIADIVAEQEGVTKIGISMPGIVGPDGTLVTSGAIEGLAGRNVGAEVALLTGIPTVVINDAHSAGMAERWVGAGADCSDFVCMTIGTGVGGSVFVNGELYRGFRGAAGEMSMALIGKGTTEEEISAVTAGFLAGGILGLGRLYAKEFGDTEPALWRTNTWEILQAAEDGEEKAVRATDQFFDGLTSLMVTVLALLDPQRILIGGGVAERPGFMEALRERFMTKVQRHPYLQPNYVPEVLPCVNGNQAGVLGAIYAADVMV